MPKTRLSFEERLANNVASPMIIRLLDPFSAEDMHAAIQENMDLAFGLKNDREYYGNLRLIVATLPFSGKVVEAVGSEKWINWFIHGPMKKQREDLYMQVTYNSHGVQYITNQVRGILKVLFS